MGADAKEQLREVLEGTVTRMTEHGWRAGPGNFYAREQPLCLMQSAAKVLTERQKLAINHYFWLIAEIQNALSDVILAEYPCVCSDEIDGIVVHWNDCHCDGGERAISVLNKAIKNLL